jgi:hypothetical protein
VLLVAIVSWGLDDEEDVRGEQRKSHPLRRSSFARVHSVVRARAASEERGVMGAIDRQRWSAMKCAEGAAAR